jgi:signal peptidase I
LKLGLVLALLGSVATFYYYFFLHLVRVPTASMANTIIPGDCLVVKKRAFGEINRGDIIVFSYPKTTAVKYVSRVIGLPRETIEIRGMSVYINGRELSEQRVMVKPAVDADVLPELSTEGSGPYRVYYSARDGNDEVSGVSPELEDRMFGLKTPFQIPDNEYFVMSDNRDNSADSRYQGAVPRSLVFGKAIMIYWSANRDRVRWNRIFNRLPTN